MKQLIARLLGHRHILSPVEIAEITQRAKDAGADPDGLETYTVYPRTNLLFGGVLGAAGYWARSDKHPHKDAFFSCRNEAAFYAQCRRDVTLLAAHARQQDKIIAALLSEIGAD